MDSKDFEEELGPLPESDENARLQRESFKALQRLLSHRDSLIYRDERVEDFGIDCSLELKVRRKVPAQTERTSGMDLGNVAQWVGAVGTISAVLVALFKEDLLRWRRRPELVAVLKAERPYCVKTPEHHGTPPNVWNGSRYFIRLMVTNMGNVRADKVEVFLSSAVVEETNQPVPNFIPMNLKWSYIGSIYADGISPDMSRLCDFAAITDPTWPPFKEERPSALSEKETCLSLILEVGLSRRDFLPPGRYKFEVTMAASNCKPVRQQFRLHLTGRWEADEKVMFAHGFVVSAIEK